MYSLWFKKTTVGFLESTDGTRSDMDTAIGLIRTYGWEEVWSVFTGTWECPKTAGIRYHERDGKTGFTFWAEKYELTRSTIQTWRNKLDAQKDAKALLMATAKPTPNSVTYTTDDQGRKYHQVAGKWELIAQ
jgi:hypothetical protein